MRVISITGASGYIGKYLVAELLRIGGYEIRVLLRSKQQAWIESKFDSRVEVIEGDINDSDSLQLLLKPGCTIINLAYLWSAGEVANLEVTRNLLNACLTVRVARLIHCSSVSVIGRAKGNKITEQTPCHPITEYAITKLKIEQTIKDKSRGHFDVVILRPTSVFGIDGVPLKKLADDLTNGNRWKNYARSSLFGNRKMNLVHITNMVASITFSIELANRTTCEVFIVSDDDAPDNNFNAVEKNLMRFLNVNDYPLPRLRLPLELLSTLLTLLGRNSVNPRCTYDPAKLLALGFQRPARCDEGLSEYAAWYRSVYCISEERTPHANS